MRPELAADYSGDAPRRHAYRLCFSTHPSYSHGESTLRPVRECSKLERRHLMTALRSLQLDWDWGRSMKPEDLNESDWDEIYYALERKAVEIEHGKLDDEPGEVNRSGSETERWAANLREIMAKIASGSRSKYL